MELRQRLLMCCTILFGNQAQIESVGRKIEVSKMSYKELRQVMEDARAAINEVTMGISVVNAGCDKKIDKL